MSRVSEFFDKIEMTLDLEGAQIAKWNGTNRRSNHLLEIDYGSSSVIIYIKESNNTPGFWGLTKNQVNRLNDSNLPWFCVLLLNSNDEGYLLNKIQVNDRVNNNSFELSQDGDYKVNEKADLSGRMYFSGIENLLNHIKSKI